MEEEKCGCGTPLNEENRCTCQPEKCYHCCSCDENCSCGCKKKAALEK